MRDEVHAIAFDQDSVLEKRRHRLFDYKNNTHVVKVLPGGHYVSNDKKETLSTTLGSCVAACIRDPQSGIGGMNHFMLPTTSRSDLQGDFAMRYGAFAMEVLINKILASGCTRERLEIKLFGGANLNGRKNGVGHMNAVFVERYLEREGLFIGAADLGGNLPRCLKYYPSTGKVLRKYLLQPIDVNIFEQEDIFKSKIINTTVTGEVEFFE